MWKNVWMVICRDYYTNTWKNKNVYRLSYIQNISGYQLFLSVKDTKKCLWNIYNKLAICGY